MTPAPLLAQLIEPLLHLGHLRAQGVEFRDDDRFFARRADFAKWAKGRSGLRMEFFYREMRRAKGVLMLRENGLPVPQDPQMPEKLAEFDYLRRSIGRTGQLALAPILQASAEDIWQLRLLGGD